MAMMDYPNVIKELCTAAPSLDTEDDARDKGGDAQHDIDPAGEGYDAFEWLDG